MKNNAKNIIKVGLVRGRHSDMPVDDFVFEDKINNIANVVKLQLLANNWVLKKMDELGTKVKNGVEIHLYITGLAPALIAALNACKTACNEASWKVVAYCYNPDTQRYFAMDVR